jgi:hypothetical protein
MSHQPNNEIQQPSTSEKRQEHLLTETHANNQNLQDLTEEQLQDVNGGLFWFAAAAAPAAFKAGKSLIKKVF